MDDFATQEQFEDELTTQEPFEALADQINSVIVKFLENNPDAEVLDVLKGLNAVTFAILHAEDDEDDEDDEDEV